MSRSKPTRWVGRDDGILMPFDEAIAEVRSWLPAGESFVSVECRPSTVGDLGHVDDVLKWVWDGLTDGECEVLHDHELHTEDGGPYLPGFSAMTKGPTPGFKALRAALAVVLGEVDMSEAAWVATGRTATVTADAVEIREGSKS